MDLELEVAGRHAMLFDDDAMAEFVNSKEALIEWNCSLFIDRFDVRNLITNPPPSFRNLTNHGGGSLVDGRLEAELDVERYADLASPDHEVDEIEVEAEVERKDVGGYHFVPFSYGNTADFSEKRNPDMGLDVSSFSPPFPVPESLLQNLPPTEKVHQIIARTAMFVGEHGGQSEIVLRVKQGDNPTFGFLMPHHHLHPYFRYLVDHPEHLKADNECKSQEEKTNESQALSLLGSVYGSGEDEDTAVEVDRESKETDFGGILAAADMSKTHQAELTVTSGDVAQKDETVSKHPQSSKGKVTLSSKYSINTIKHGHASGVKRDGNILPSNGSSIDKPKSSTLFPLSNAEKLHVDPPSEVKRLVDRIVEIILKNGKDFEAVPVEQDKKRGRFPFLLPSNQYHSYYLRVLKKAQESRISGKSFSSVKSGSSWQEMDKNIASEIENDSASLGSGSHDLSLDCDRKEKFKMVITKAKKDSQDHPSKETQQQCGITVDTAAAAAILQAATRGIRKPSLNMFSKASHGSSNEGGQASGLGDGKPVTVSVAKEIAKTAAHSVAGEADSSEAGLSKEQKLKAERLRRAKMFAAMVKSGVAPLGTEPPRALSVEPSGSEISNSATEFLNEEVKEREGSCAPAEAGTSNKMLKLLKKLSEDETDDNSRKRRHYRSNKHDDSKGDEADEGKEEEEDDDGEEEDKRRSRKKHTSRHSSRHHRDRSKDRHKHRRRHTSSKSKESRHRHDNESSSSMEEEDRYHHHKPDSSSEDERKHHKRRRKHDSSSETDSKYHKRKHRRSRKADDRHKRSSRKHEKRSHAEEAELEEGEIRTKSSDQSPASIGDDVIRETSLNITKSSHQDKRTSSLPPPETSEIPDDLRAKIRAMLLANM